MKRRLVKPRLPSGVMELLPWEQAAFDELLGTIRRGFESHGFTAIDTPAIELSDILLTKSGGETEKQVYFLQSTGALERGKKPDTALRFDLTVPLARYVAMNERRLPFPFRRYHIGRVYRGESSQRGRYREFYQCDIDIVGRNHLGLMADAEMPAVISGIFRELSAGPFTIRISNRKLLAGFFQAIDITDPCVASEATRLVDKIDKIGMDSVLGSLQEHLALNSTQIDCLKRFLSIDRNPGKALEQLARIEPVSGTFQQGLSELEEVFEGIELFGVPWEDLALDTTIARGLDYYTGTVFETVLDDHRELGSVCSGGRYDDLAGHYTKARLPGVGVSIGATRLFYQLREAGLLAERKRRSMDVLVADLDASTRPRAIETARRLREAGLKVHVWTEGGKLRKQLSWADRMAVPLVVLIGPDELARSEAGIKVLATGEQLSIALDALPSELVGLLEGQDSKDR